MSPPTNNWMFALWLFISIKFTYNFISNTLIREVWIQKTSLTAPLFIEVPVPSQENEQSCICVFKLWFSSLYDFFI